MPKTKAPPTTTNRVLVRNLESRVRGVNAHRIALVKMDDTPLLALAKPLAAILVALLEMECQQVSSVKFQVSRGRAAASSRPPLKLKT